MWIKKIRKHLSRMVEKMDKYEKILKGLIKNNLPQNITGTSKDSGCITDEIFSSYLENLLDDKGKEIIEGHLIHCNVCRQKNITLHRIKEEIQKENLLIAPMRATERAKQLVNAPVTHNLVEVILGFAKNTVRIIKNTGAIFQPLEFAPALARGGESEHSIPNIPEAGNITFLVNKFSGLTVELTVEKITEFECDIEVKTTDAQSIEPIDNIRFNLLLGERELFSYLTRQGYTAFKNLPLDAYTIEVVRKKETLGKINLKLELG